MKRNNPKNLSKITKITIAMTATNLLLTAVNLFLYVKNR